MDAYDQTTYKKTFSQILSYWGGQVNIKCSICSIPSLRFCVLCQFEFCNVEILVQRISALLHLIAHELEEVLDTDHIPAVAGVWVVLGLNYIFTYRYANLNLNCAQT